MIAAKPVVETKPAEVKAAPAPVAAILDLPAVGIKPAGEIKKEIKKEIEKAPAPKVAAAAEIAVPEAAIAPDLTFGQTRAERTGPRPGMVVLLLCIVVAAAFAAGVWWKLKNSQMGSAMVTEKIVQKPDATATPQTAIPATGTNSATALNPTPDAISDANEPVNTPATPQELAKFPRVSGIRHWSSATSSTVVLDLEDQVQYEAHRLAKPERIYFDLRDTQLSAEAAKGVDVAGDPLLNRVRVAQPVAGMTRVVLETRTDSNFSVSLEPNPYRLVIEVHKVGVSNKGAVNLFPNAEAEKSRLAIVVPPPTREDLQLRAHVPKLRIVVDAGHGGWDSALSVAAACWKRISSSKSRNASVSCCKAGSAPK